MLKNILGSTETMELYISSGEYEIDETIKLDFDVKISGNETSTTLKRSGGLLTVDSISNTTISEDKPIFLIGSINNPESPLIKKGITIENLCIDSRFSIGQVSNSILINERNTRNPLKKININNIRFIGPDSVSQNNTQEIPICYQRKILLAT